MPLINVGMRGKHFAPPALMDNCPTCSHMSSLSPINPVNGLLTL